MVVAPLTVNVTPPPLALSEPPVIENPPSIVELAVTLSAAPLTESVAPATTEMLCTLTSAVMATLLPERPITASSFTPGTAPPYQFDGSLQLVPSPMPDQFTDRSVRPSNCSKRST